MVPKMTEQMNLDDIEVNLLLVDSLNCLFNLVTLVVFNETSLGHRGPSRLMLTHCLGIFSVHSFLEISNPARSNLIFSKFLENIFRGVKGLQIVPKVPNCLISMTLVLRHQGEVN